MGLKTFILFPVLLLISHTSAAAISANEYIDTVLNSALRYEVQTLNLDPLPVQDFLTYFEDRVKLFGKVKGYVNYTNGQLTGLSHPKRYSDCQGPVNRIGVTYLNCTIFLEQLQIAYNGRLKYGKLPSVNIKATATMQPIVLFVDVVQFPGNPLPVLRYFRFLEIGLIDTKFTGLGPLLDKQPLILDGPFRERVWQTFFYSIAEGFQFVLSRSVSLIPLPDLS